MSIGVSEDRFWNGTPNDLEPFAKADLLARKQRDVEAWNNGAYTLSAVGTALSMAIAGRKSKVKYIEKPLLETAQERYDAERAERGELSKIEEDAYVDKLFDQLERMEKTFKNLHKT